MDDSGIRIFKMILKNGQIRWSVHQDCREDAIRLINYGDEPLALAGWREERIDLLVGILKTLAAVIPPADPPAAVETIFHGILKTIGEELFQLVFKNAVRKEFNTLMRQLKQGELQLLRVEIEFGDTQAQELARWPWEYLCSPREAEPYTGVFLASVTELMLNRRLYLQNAGDARLKTPPPLRVLLVVSRPRNLGPVQHQQVLAQLTTLGDTRRIHLKTLIEDPSFSPDYQWQVTRTRFQECIKGGFGAGERFLPHVIHFIGHGRYAAGHGQVAFSAEGGEADWVADDRFAEWVKHRELKLVFLQACESAVSNPHKSISGMALKLAHQNIPAVVAMQDKVENAVASAFACRFYQSLADRQPIDLAVRAGRRALENLHHDTQRLAFGVPVLYLRSYQGLIDEEPGGPSLSVRAEEAPARGERARACPRCRSAVAENVCPNCGLWLSCTQCGLAFEIPERVNFCTQCGAAVPRHPWSPPDAGDAAGGPGRAEARV